MNYTQKLAIDAVSVDYSVPTDWIVDKLLPIKVVQGNLDPYLLAFDINKAINKSEEILSKFGKSGHIFNLGHGIFKETPVENVYKIVDFVKNYSK